MNLTDTKWKPFKVKELFEIEKCKCSNASKLSKNNGLDKIPYVGATNRNNGTMYFVENNKQLTTKGNCIVFICDGQGSVGYSFYKEEDFIGSTTLKVGRNPHLNKYNAFFITAALDKNKELYSYGYKRTENRLKNEVIYLPINEFGTPNFEFMEKYTKQLESSKKELYYSYVKNQLSQLSYREIPSLESKEWKEFKLYDICNISSGKDIYEKERIDGNMPYITSTSSNNGIKYFISNSNHTIDTNAISVNRNGSVGYAFYHKYEALYSNDCRKLKLKKHNTPYTSLFITNQIMQQKEKYNYGYKMGTLRLQKQFIMLPVNNLGEPDYEYMEQYIKNIILKKYNDYLYK